MPEEFLRFASKFVFLPYRQTRSVHVLERIHRFMLARNTDIDALLVVRRTADFFCEKTFQECRNYVDFDYYGDDRETLLRGSAILQA